MIRNQLIHRKYRERFSGFVFACCLFMPFELRSFFCCIWWCNFLKIKIIKNQPNGAALKCPEITDRPAGESWSQWPIRQKTESLQMSMKVSSLKNFCLSYHCRQIKLVRYFGHRKCLFLFVGCKADRGHKVHSSGGSTLQTSSFGYHLEGREMLEELVLLKIGSRRLQSALIYVGKTKICMIL